MGAAFFQSNPGFSTATRAVSAANATLTAADYTVVMSTGGTNRTATLPAASTNSGKIFVIKKALGDTSFATITPSDGTFTTTLDTFGETIMIQSDGSTYQVLGRYIPSIWTAYTPTGTWGTTTYTGFWRRVGDGIDLDLRLICTNVPNGNCTIDLPSGLTINTSEMTSATASITQLGRGTTRDDSTGALYGIAAMYKSTTDLGMFVVNTSGASYETFDQMTHAVPFSYTVDDTVQLRVFGLPISGWKA